MTIINSSHDPKGARRNTAAVFAHWGMGMTPPYSANEPSASAEHSEPLHVNASPALRSVYDTSNPGPVEQPGSAAARPPHGTA